MALDKKRLVIKSDEALFNKAKEFEKKYNLFGFSGIVQNNVEIGLEEFEEYVRYTSSVVSTMVKDIVNESTNLLQEISDHIISTNTDADRKH